MRKRGVLSALLPIVFACFALPVQAQATTDGQPCTAGKPGSQTGCMTLQSGDIYDPQTELMTVVVPKIEADTTSASPLGDDYDPVTGSITFSTTDISLPGNFPIPVELRRWVPGDDFNTGGPTGWAWNIPFIRGNYLALKGSDPGWDWGINTWRHGSNCTGSAETVYDNHGQPVSAGTFWQGKMLHIPGVTSETFLDNAGAQVTKSNFKIVSCITNPDGQQGIVVAGPDGLTYTFNQVRDYYNGKLVLKAPVVRTKLLMVTKIEDRFGNRVDYAYTNGELTGITASDGRAITINYALVGTTARRPTTAVAHGRTWTYAYAGSTAQDRLVTVTLPDGVSKWTYSNVQVAGFQPDGVGTYHQRFRIGTYELSTIIPGCSTTGDQYTATVTTPWGLTSTYTLQDRILYRSEVDPDWYVDIRQTEDYVITRSLHCTLDRVLVAKTIAGPGIPTASWSYQYSNNTGTYIAGNEINGYLTGPFVLPVPAAGGYPAPINSANATNYRSTTVIGPDRKLIFYVDRKFQSLTENRVVAQDTLDAAGSVLLKRTGHTFEASFSVVGNHWYQCNEGCTLVPINEIQATNRIHETQTTDTYHLLGGSDTYTTTQGPFDSYGFALTSQGWNSIDGTAKMQQIDKTYLHDTVNGLIGLPLTETTSLSNQPDPHTTMVVQNHYNALGQLDWTKAFGKLKATLIYSADGNVHTVKDGNNNITTVTDWKRGTPQSVLFADGTGRSGVVDDSGWLMSTTDENGYTTSYTYDAMGQLASIVRPTGDSTTWATTTRTMVSVASTEYGLAAGHWRETISTGNGRKLVYYDALLRPRVIREYDAANESVTKRFQRFAYDLDGRTVFAAYPGTSDALSTGTWTQYDALGRVTSVAQDTELVPALQISATDYLNGGRVRTTNPRGNQTTTTYMAYGQPSTDWPVIIAAPEGVTTTIVRDVFGKPLSINRGDAP